jgi:hypothetical protein
VLLLVAAAVVSVGHFAVESFPAVVSLVVGCAMGIAGVGNVLQTRRLASKVANVESKVNGTRNRLQPGGDRTLSALEAELKEAERNQGSITQMLNKLGSRVPSTTGS